MISGWTAGKTGRPRSLGVRYLGRCMCRWLPGSLPISGLTSGLLGQLPSGRRSTRNTDGSYFWRLWGVSAGRRRTAHVRRADPRLPGAGGLPACPQTWASASCPGTILDERQRGTFAVRVTAEGLGLLTAAFRAPLARDFHLFGIPFAWLLGYVR